MLNSNIFYSLNTLLCLHNTYFCLLKTYFYLNYNLIYLFYVCFNVLILQAFSKALGQTLYPSLFLSLYAQGSESSLCLQFPHLSLSVKPGIPLTILSVICCIHWSRQGTIINTNILTSKICRPNFRSSKFLQLNK